VRLPFEGSAVPFRGCGAPAVREWVVQCHGVVADHAAQCRTATGVGGAVLGHASQARSGMDSPFTWTPADVSALNALAGGAGMEATGP
jgi:hypothetical protein